jgi:hypothetical protein
MAFQGLTWLGVAVTGAMVSMVWMGCEPPAPAAPRKPVETELLVEAPLDAVWDATVEWFATRGLPIKNIDKASGLLATEHTMPTTQAGTVMSCGTPGPKPNGKVEHVDHRTHFNVLLRAQGPRQTKVTVNAFFDCLVNTYENVDLFGAQVRLDSSVRHKCGSTGSLERSILSRLEKVKPAPGASGAEAPTLAPSATQPAVAPSGAEPAAPAMSACTTDAECRGGRVCRAGVCTKAACAKDVDCPEPQICESGACHAPTP